MPKGRGIRNYNRTIDDIKKEVYDLVGDEYTVLSDTLEGMSKKILFRHNCDECEEPLFLMTPKAFIQRNNRCPARSCNPRTKTLKQFKQDVYNKYGNEYTVLSDTYTNNKINMVFRHNCDKCNNFVFIRTANSFLDDGNTCSKCKPGGHVHNRTIDSFKLEIKQLVKNEYTVLSDHFDNIDQKFKFRHNCDLCNNYEFEMRGYAFLSNGHRCPECNRLKRQSKMTEIMEMYLNAVNINFIREYKFDNCKYKRELPFDFYIPKFNTIIELDGQQHFENTFRSVTEEWEDSQIRDSIKNKYCKENNITLIRIPYNLNIEEYLEDIKDTIINNNYDKLISLGIMIITNDHILNENTLYQNMINRLGWLFK